MYGRLLFNLTGNKKKKRKKKNTKNSTALDTAPGVLALP